MRKPATNQGRLSCSKDAFFGFHVSLRRRSFNSLVAQSRPPNVLVDFFRLVIDLTRSCYSCHACAPQLPSPCVPVAVGLRACKCQRHSTLISKLLELFQQELGVPLDLLEENLLVPVAESFHVESSCLALLFFCCEEGKLCSGGSVRLETSFRGIQQFSLLNACVESATFLAL